MGWTVAIVMLSFLLGALVFGTGLYFGLVIASMEDEEEDNGYRSETLW